jgi:hypothetical protein
VKIEIYDPAMCCPTGVCGPSVDPKLTAFAADLNWLKEQGVEVERFNLAQQPQAFAESAMVAGELQNGTECLPLVLVDGEIVARSFYPDRAALAQLCEIELEEAAPVSSCGYKPGKCC